MALAASIAINPSDGFAGEHSGSARGGRIYCAHLTGNGQAQDLIGARIKGGLVRFDEFSRAGGSRFGQSAFPICACENSRIVNIEHIPEAFFPKLDNDGHFYNMVFPCQVKRQAGIGVSDDGDRGHAFSFVE
jgi:hypothetical protein